MKNNVFVVFNLITIRLQEQYQKAGKEILKKMKKYEFDPSGNHPEDDEFMKASAKLLNLERFVGNKLRTK